MAKYTNHITDEQIAASWKHAEELLAKLDLSDVEREWARQQSKKVFHDVTEAFLTSGMEFSDLRAIVAPAAMAFALSLARDWADTVTDMANEES